MDSIIRFSISLPKQLLDELDSKIGSQGYASRSEFTKIVQDSWKNGDDELIGVLTLIYTHRQNDLIVKMMGIEHDANVDIVCTTHIHVNRDNCLETLVLRGKARNIENLADKIGGLKGVKFSKLTKAAIPHS